MTVLLADLPAEVGGVPVAVQIGVSVGAVLLVLAVMRWLFWWLVGSRAPSYRPRRAYRWWKPGQRRPARPVEVLPPLDDDYGRVIPAVGEPLAIEAAPRPYRYASRAQHKEPLAEELTW